MGGALRDALLGFQNLDWDIATSARPEIVQRLFRRTVPVGVRFGTVGVLERDGHLYEVTTFRRDVRTDGRHAEVEFGVSLEDDLARRDFTINAMAFDPIAQRFEDPFDGRGDLARKVVRAVGRASERFHEDRLRSLRALRFAARLGFSIEPETWEAICASTPYLRNLSAERVRQELEKTMEQVERPSTALRLWRSSGALAALIPPLDGLPDRHLLAPDYLRPPAAVARPFRRTLRLAALLSALDERALQSTLRDLTFSNNDRAFIVGVSALWRELGDEMTGRLTSSTIAAPTDRELRQWLARIGRLRVGHFFRLAVAFWRAEQELGLPAPEPAAICRLYRRLLRIARTAPLGIADLHVDGDDLRRAGVAAGPELGRILQALVQQVLNDPSMNTREALLALVATLRNKPTSAPESS